MTICYEDRIAVERTYVAPGEELDERSHWTLLPDSFTTTADAEAFIASMQTADVLVADHKRNEDIRDKNSEEASMPAATKIPAKHKDRKFKFSFDSDEIVMAEEHYANGRLCIQLYATGQCPEPFGTLTMNLPEDDPGENAFFVKTYSENEPLTRELLATGVFVEVQHPREVVWKFAP